MRSSPHIGTALGRRSELLQGKWYPSRARPMASGSVSMTASPHNRSSWILAEPMRSRPTRPADGSSGPMTRSPGAIPACGRNERGVGNAVMNPHHWLPTFACIAIAAMMMPRPAHAATFDADLARDSCQLRLSGAIERGDLDRLKAKLPADFDPDMKAGP